MKSNAKNWLKQQIAVYCSNGLSKADAARTVLEILHEGGYNLSQQESKAVITQAEKMLRAAA